MTTTRLYDNATIEDVYQLMRKTHEGNNWVDGVKIQFFEHGRGSERPLTLLFRGSGGFREDQRERRGIVEIIREDETITR